jgi:predicted metal-dependent phosphoesterase TrpH
MIIDLHTHTYPKSHDSQFSPGELILQAKKVGLDGICFAEHGCFWNREAAEQLGREYDYLVIPGAELDTEDGHMLVFGIDEMEFGLQSSEFVREALDKAGGFMILPHPHRNNYLYGDIPEAVEQCFRKPIFKLVDTIETLNGRVTEKEREFSRALSRKLGWQGTGGSDAHGLEDVPTCATKFEQKIRNLEELIQELKAGRYQPVELRRKKMENNFSGLDLA